MLTRRWFGVIVLMLCASQAIEAQDTVTTTGWKKNLTFDLTTTQSAYSNSWVGGEAGSFSWVSNLNGNAEKQLSPKINYSNVLKVSFGQTFTQDEETKDWSRGKKSTDLIDLDNLWRFTLGGFVDPYAAFRIESQFYTEHLGNIGNYKRVYFRPLTLTQSAGIARRFYSHPEADQITSRLGLAVREVFFTSLLDSATLASNEDMYTDGGLESVTDAILTLNKNVQYQGKLSLFKALFFSEKDKVKGTPEEDYWKSPDVNFENQLNVNVTKLIVVKLYTQFLYDKQVTTKGRFKETLALGLAYRIW